MSCRLERVVLIMVKEESDTENVVAIHVAHKIQEMMFSIMMPKKYAEQTSVVHAIRALRSLDVKPLLLLHPIRLTELLYSTGDIHPQVAYCITHMTDICVIGRSTASQ